MKRAFLLLPAAWTGLAIVGLALSGCTVPGIPTTRVLAQETVTVDGRTCQYVTRRTETATVNGMHRSDENMIRCKGRDYACDDRTADDCIGAIAAAQAGRGTDGTAG